MMSRYEKSICQIDKSWLKGRLQECVVDSKTDEIICIVNENHKMANIISMLLNDYEKGNNQWRQLTK